MSQSNLHTLSQQTPIKDTLAQQQADYDCTPCRLMGSAAFTGLGVYSYASGMSQLKQREREIAKSGSKLGLGARKVGVFGLSAVLVGMGVYRLKY